MGQGQGRTLKAPLVHHRWYCGRGPAVLPSAVMQAKQAVPGLGAALITLGIVLVVVGGLATLLFLVGVIAFHNAGFGFFALPCLIVTGVGVALLVVGRRALPPS